MNYLNSSFYFIVPLIYNAVKPHYHILLLINDELGIFQVICVFQPSALSLMEYFHSSKYMFNAISKPGMKVLFKVLLRNTFLTMILTFKF